jgi:uncharacterized protein
MATIVADTLGWYGKDAFGGSVHDVIGTRCDPYTHHLLSGGQYHHCCHSNLTRALCDATGLPLPEAETHVHDVLNVFMCTGFTRDTGQYFMKASPVRPGDYLEFFAEIPLAGRTIGLSGGRLFDGAFLGSGGMLSVAGRGVRDTCRCVGSGRDSPPPNGYDRSHGR